MARIKMHIPKAKLPFYPPYEVKCRLQNGVSTLLFFNIITNSSSIKGLAPDFDAKSPSYISELGSKTLGGVGYTSVVCCFLGLHLFIIFALEMLLLAFNLLIGQA